MKIWLSYPSYSYHLQFIGLWYINLAFYLSFDELIKGIISNWCQRLFKELKLRGVIRVLESSNSFLHHKIDWKNCEMDWSLISSTKIIFSYIITILSISHWIQERSKLFLFSIMLHIYELEMHYFISHHYWFFLHIRALLCIFALNYDSYTME